MERDRIDIRKRGSSKRSKEIFVDFMQFMPKVSIMFIVALPSRPKDPAPKYQESNSFPNDQSHIQNQKKQKKRPVQTLPITQLRLNSKKVRDIEKKKEEVKSFIVQSKTPKCLVCPRCAANLQKKTPIPCLDLSCPESDSGSEFPVLAEKCCG